MKICLANFIFVQIKITKQSVLECWEYSYWIFCTLFPCHLPPANCRKKIIENFFCHTFFFARTFFHQNFFFCLKFFPPNICLLPKNLFGKICLPNNFSRQKNTTGPEGTYLCSPPQELIIFKLKEPAFWRKHWLNLKSNYNIGNLPITVSQKIKLHFEVRNFKNWGTGREVGQQWNSLEQS